MRMAIPLTSRPTKLSAVIQWVTRTTPECLGESWLSASRIASPCTYAVSAITTAAAIIAHEPGSPRMPRSRSESRSLTSQYGVRRYPEVRNHSSLKGLRRTVQSHALPLRLQRNRAGNTAGYVVDLVERWKQRRLRVVPRWGSFRERFCGGHEHSVSHTSSMGSEHGQPHGGKYIAVVALRDLNCLASKTDVRKRAARGDDRPPIGPFEQVLRFSFTVRIRIRQRQDDRSWSMPRHLANDLFGE